MRRALCATAILIALFKVPASGDANDALREAQLAWDRGDYVAALNGFLGLLNSGEVDQALEPIALETGELFTTVELTADGAEPQFSPDGRLASYETGPTARRVTRIVSIDAPRKSTAELPGSGLSFSPDGSRVAWLKLPPSPELDAAQAQIEGAPQTERAQRQTALNQRVESLSRLTIRDLTTGREAEIDTGSLRKSAAAFTAEGHLVFAATDGGPVQIYIAGDGRPPAALTTGDTDKALIDVNVTGTAVLFSARTPGGGGRGGGGGAPQTFGLLTLSDGRSTMLTGNAPAFSPDGGSILYITREASDYRIVVAPISAPTPGTIVRKGPERVDAPALSRDGSRIVFQMMPKEDWELYVVHKDGSGEARLTREIQHDVLPRFVTADRILATMGEARHRRSYLYDLPSGKRTRLFHNNTIRTIAPEYSWATSTDGTKVLITAERDGNTVSPERGIYLVDLARRVTREELIDRIKTNLAAEQALRAKGRRLYAPISAAVAKVAAEASTSRVYRYEKALFDFDSKHITRPGNKQAADYLLETYKSFGYEPQFQTFDRPQALGGKTSNVLATLKGTVNPELVYVVSSHYDSVAVGPGADDDTSGTAALLETARIMANHPQPATIIFASFTGEEAGLLGSREFVRRAVADKLQIVGALNNDMVGWANDHRLDNTIRYSNVGIRDIQHAAAMQFSNMITYDALYYRSTDAAAYYEVYGDIVGGIGSYPVLGNPHYHQSHDLLDTINHQLVTEVSKTTAATLMLLASSPSRLKDLKIDSQQAGGVTVSWMPALEKGVTAYLVAWGPPETPEAQQMKVTKTSATIAKAAPGTVILVKALNAKGLEGWDWARVVVR